MIPDSYLAPIHPAARAADRIGDAGERVLTAVLGGDRDRLLSAAEHAGRVYDETRWLHNVRSAHLSHETQRVYRALVELLARYIDDSWPDIADAFRRGDESALSHLWLKAYDDGDDGTEPGGRTALAALCRDVVRAGEGRRPLSPDLDGGLAGSVRAMAVEGLARLSPRDRETVAALTGQSAEADAMAVGYVIDAVAGVVGPSFEAIGEWLGYVTACRQARLIVRAADVLRGNTASLPALA